MTVLLLVCRDLRGRFDFIFSRGQNEIYGEYIKWGCRCSERLRTKVIVEEMKVSHRLNHSGPLDLDAKTGLITGMLAGKQG